MTGAQPVAIRIRCPNDFEWGWVLFGIVSSHCVLLIHEVCSIAVPMTVPPPHQLHGQRR